jgi:hypothetical protein
MLLSFTVKEASTMVSQSQKDAVKKYKKKVNRFSIEFYPTDNELWDWLNEQPNKQGYIKSLILADLVKSQEEIE